MNLSEQLNSQNSSAGSDISSLVQEIDKLAAAGHKVEAKGTQACYIDDHLMVFLHGGMYENHKTGERADLPANLTASDLEALLGDKKSPTNQEAENGAQ